MRIVAIGVAVGYVLATIALHTLGKPWGCVIIGLTFGGAWVGHTERSRYLVGLMRAAVERHLSGKVAAALAGVSPARVSEWWSGEEQASFSRMAEWPDAVIDDFCGSYLKERGYEVIESGRVAEMTQAVRALEAAVTAQGTYTMPRQGAA